MNDFETIPLVFNVNKPVGITSFAAVYHFKKNLSFNFGKIGHFGTLDPFAEGVLIIGIQGAQKLNDYVHELLPKTYRAKGEFGIKTQSGDKTSAVILNQPINSIFQNFSINEIEEFVKNNFLNEYWQRPHVISAVKFEGKRLYQHALEGNFIEKEKSLKKIYSFKVHSFKYPILDFEICVSSGTYVRSFFEDLALLFGGVGVLETLKRIATGPMKISESIAIENWPKKNLEFNLLKYGTPIDEFIILNKVLLNDSDTRKYVQGRRISQLDFKIIQNKNICTEKYFWAYHEDGKLLGLAEIRENELCAIFNLNASISFFS